VAEGTVVRPTSDRRISSLDGLRGVAIALVVISHGWGDLRGRDEGVIAFFVLSGYLITTLLLEEHARTGTIDLRAFYLRRAARILPAMWLTLLVATVLLVVVLPWPHARHVIAVTVLPAIGFVANIAASLWWTQDRAMFLSVMWSLALEEQFYLLWPLLMRRLLPRHGPRRLLVVALVGAFLSVAIRLAMALAGVGTAHINFAPYSRVDAIMVGCGLAVLLRQQWLPWPRLAAWGGLVVFAFSILVSGPLSNPASAYTMAAAGAAGLLVGTLTPGPLSRALSFRPLVWLGRISYSLYLFHLMLLWLIGYYWHLTLAVHLVWLAASVLASWLSYRFVEQPFIRRVHRARATA
jgi:peptidoglycan/LPS O-acetylase OafA/YrhL